MAEIRNQKSAGESLAVARGFARLDDIVAGMEVVSLCGCCLGTVDRLEGDSIQLTGRDGGRHFIQIEWVARVDAHVHLNTDVFETKRGWSSATCFAGRQSY